MYNKSISITFITPHQNPTSGGVYAIHQIARNLAQYIDVNLVVQSGDPHPIDRINIFSSKILIPREIPDADAIIHPADAPTGYNFNRLPKSKGKRYLYLQGFGDAESEFVTYQNLREKCSVIAPSRWLTEEAIRLGSPCYYVPYGLDHQVFYRGDDKNRKTNLVAMMVHRLDWKGTYDGLKALSIVKDSFPDIELVLFGDLDTTFSAKFIHNPSRNQVADYLRRCTIFVCASWEEGFGMPGLEAIACGATLATTDTKGSRDYAFDGNTALVSPAKDPEKLAKNIIQLLKDRRLRERLADEGYREVVKKYKPWTLAALNFWKPIYSNLPNSLKSSNSIWQDIYRNSGPENIQFVQEKIKSQRSEIVIGSQKAIDFESKLKELTESLQQKDSKLKEMSDWNEKLQSGILALLSSKRWKIGNALGNLKEMFKLEKHSPSRGDSLLSIIREYKIWQNDNINF